MKHFIVIAALTLMLSACQDSKDSTSSSENLKIQQFDKNLGGKINTEKALQWIDNATKTGIQKGEVYSISQANLKRAINSSENIQGMIFHCGIDEQGKQHIILTPVDGDFNIWSSVAIDANTDSEISIETAKAWTRTYIEANDETTPRQHIYGINIFKEIERYHAFEIVKVVNDEHIPQLLMVMKNAAAGGKESTIVYDNGKVCPPSCP
jgi:hypothetical protein